MKQYEIKNLSDFGGLIEDVDMKSRTVTGYFSRFGNIDHDQDMLVSGSFVKSIKERGHEGKNMIPHLLDHSAWETLKMLSKPKLYERPDGGFFESTISDTQNGSDVLKLYADGVINQHSFGFKVIKSENKSNYREIKEVMLYEISTVVLGANSDTPFTGFKSLSKEGLINQYKLLKNAYDSGTYSDWIFPILEAQIKQIQNDLIDVFIEPNNTQPSSKELLAQIELLKLKI